MRLRTLCLCLFSLAALLGAQQAPDDSEEIINRARKIITEHLFRTLNYACVQMIQRSFYAPEHGSPTAGCAAGIPGKNIIMKDRLRLDVAVSGGQEIYSWHGEAKFSSTRVSDIVKTGPSSSGSFFGFLANIFVKGGARVSYTGRSTIDGVQAFTFSFVMPREASGYKVETRDGADIIPYHGIFAINTSTFELVRLEIKGDEIPPESRMCLAETDVNYQMVAIGGRPAMIPGIFELRIEDRDGASTVSESQYTGCREFRGESTLLFDSGSIAPRTTPPYAQNLQLPAGVKFHVELKSPVDDQTSFTGDPVHAILLDKLKIESLQAIIPKGAALHGIIEKLELRYQPHPHYFASILFDRLTAPDASYTLKARPITLSRDIQKMGAIYGWPLPSSVIPIINRGVIVSTSPHIHLEKHVLTEWITLNVHQPLSPQ